MAGYGGIGGVSPVFTAILTQPFQAAALRPGQVLQGIVQSIEPQTLIRFGGIVLPVEKVAWLLPGQAVSAEILQSDHGLQLRITPSAQGAPHFGAAPTNQAPLPDLPGFIVGALQALGKLELAEQAAALVPRAAAANANAVRLVLSLLLDSEDGHDAAARAAQMLRQAVDEGALTETEVRAVLPALQSLAADDPGELAYLLRHTASASQRPLAARLAEALAKNDMNGIFATFADDVPAAMSRLVDHDPFAEFLKNTGQLADYRRAVEQIADRFAAAQLVNARGSDVPYLFFAVPLAPDAPVRRAHVHIMGEGGGKAQRFDAKNATVALDLSTSALGDLWITLSAAHGACTCWIRACELDTVALLNAKSGELAARLAHAGYPGASVQAALWDGGRVHELAAMMRRFKGLDLDA